MVLVKLIEEFDVMRVSGFHENMLLFTLPDSSK